MMAKTLLATDLLLQVKAQVCLSSKTMTLETFSFEKQSTFLLKNIVSKAGLNKKIAVIITP